jgi:hypothetical protein
MFNHSFAPLIEIGAEVRFLSADPPLLFDAVVDLSLDGERRRFVVERKTRAPFPSEVPHFVDTRKPPPGMRPILNAPYISEGVGETLVRHGWSWIDDEGNYDVRAPRVRISRRQPKRGSKSPSPRLPQGPGSWGIIRFLISHGEMPLRASHLANVAHVSQPRASQVLSTLVHLELAERTDEGWVARREALLDAFLESYAGPGGSQAHFYTLEPLLSAATAITRANNVGTYLSADVGADVLVPWRQATHLIVYAKRALRMPPELAVRAKSVHDANITIRVPTDLSIFCFIEHEVSTYGSVLRLAEHTQIIWDLITLGGDDRREAAKELTTWLLRPL